jgi:hypothetical protein
MTQDKINREELAKYLVASLKKEGADDVIVSLRQELCWLNLQQQDKHDQDGRPQQHFCLPLHGQAASERKPARDPPGNGCQQIKKIIQLAKTSPRGGYMESQRQNQVQET